MKKRVLSFLMACFMVVSTFIISKPLVHVHAVEDEQTYVEGENQWTLPMDWATGVETDANGWSLPIKGNWALRVYSNIDTNAKDITASSALATDDKVHYGQTDYAKWQPQPYLANTTNERYVQNNSTTGYGAAGWYMNFDARWSVVAFRSERSGAAIGGVTQKGKPVAIVFTAPEDGIYSFSEVVEGVLFTYGESDVRFAATVRRNGAVITSFNPTPDNTTATLSGEVMLEKGDELMFAFAQTTAVSVKNDGASNYIVKDVVVKKVAGVSSTAEYNMPTKWLNCTDVDANGWSLAKQGNWRLSCSDPKTSAILWKGSTTAWSGAYATTCPQPWYNGGVQVSGSTSWYINGGVRWAGVTLFDMGVEGSFFQVIPSASLNPTVIFDVPADGVYLYSEIVNAVDFYDNDNNNATTGGSGVQLSGLNDPEGKAIEVLVTVRRNGAAIDSFVIDNDNRAALLEGTVELNANDMLSFTFVLMTNNATIYNHDDFLHFYEAKLVKIADLDTTGKTVDLTPKFEVGSVTDKNGFVTLMGYKTDAEGVGSAKLYPVTEVVTETTNGTWIAIDQLGKHGTDYSWGGSNRGYNLLWAINKETGLITNVGGSQKTSNTGSAIVFTAPYNGKFSFLAELSSTYLYSGTHTRYHDFTIMKGDGTVLVTTCNNGLNDGYVEAITAIVELVKGEQVIITKTPNAKCTQKNISANGSAKVTISELNHVCSADTVKAFDANDATCVAGGNIAYYGCSCGAKYANADATEPLDSVDTPVDEDAHAPADEWTADGDGHWHVCGNGCEEKLDYAEHDWTNEDGVCAICELGCTHDWSNKDGICATCGVECGRHDWSNKDGVCANCGMTHNHIDSSIGTTCNNDGTHTDYCAECGYVYGSESCKPMEGNLCKCDYDCSAMIAEDNFDEVFDSYYNGGETDYVANGPATGAFDNVGAVKGADVDGFKYMGFNLEMSADKNTFYLRHHVLLSGDLAVKVGEADAALTFVSGNYCYFDVEVKIGEFGVNHTITADGTAVVTASVYSYMKTALESGELSAEQTNLLKALYDWDYAVANAN